MEHYICVCVSVTQLCPTLCDPMDDSPPGSSVHEILQARTLECIAISFSSYMYVHITVFLNIFTIFLFNISAPTISVWRAYTIDYLHVFYLKAYFILLFWLLSTYSFNSWVLLVKDIGEEQKGRP